MWTLLTFLVLTAGSALGAPPNYQAQPQETVDAAAAEHNNQGAQLANQGRFLEAVREFRKAIQLVPNFVGAYYNLGRAYMQLKAYDDAAKAFAAAVQSKPNYGDAWYQLGIALQMQNAYSHARQAYLTALSFFPNDPNLLYRLGFVYIQEKDWEQAAHFWGRLRDEYPDHPALVQVQQHLPHLYFNLGTQHYASGAMEEAQKAFLKTLEFDGSYGAAYYNLGLVYRDLEQFDQSQSALKNALELEYDPEQVRNVLGHVYALKGNLKDAEAMFKAALEGGGQSLDPHRGLVTLKLKQKDVAGALVEALNVVVNAPQDPASFLLLAFVYEHNNEGERYGPGYQSDQAIKAYKRVIGRDKNNFTAHYNLGLIYGRLGDWELALKELKKAQELDPNHAGVQKWLPQVELRYDQAQ